MKIMQRRIAKKLRKIRWAILFYFLETTLLYAVWSKKSSKKKEVKLPKQKENLTIKIELKVRVLWGKILRKLKMKKLNQEKRLLKILG